MNLKDLVSKDNNEKKEKLTRQNAFDIIDEWAEKTRSKLYEDTLQEIKDILWVEVKDERLVLNSDLKSFDYVLSETINDKEGNVVISKVLIKKTKIDKLLKAEELKSKSEQNLAAIQNHCVDSNGDEIGLGFIMRIDPSDVIIISSVIKAFFY